MVIGLNENKNLYVLVLNKDMAPNVYFFFDYSHKINKFIFFLIVLTGWKVANLNVIRRFAHL